MQKPPKAPRRPRITRPKATVIFTDGDGFWTGKRRRRDLDRAAFLDLVARGQVVVIRV